MWRYPAVPLQALGVTERLGSPRPKSPPRSGTGSQRGRRNLLPQPATPGPARRVGPRPPFPSLRFPPRCPPRGRALGPRCLRRPRPGDAPARPRGRRPAANHHHHHHHHPPPLPSLRRPGGSGPRSAPFRSPRRGLARPRRPRSGAEERRGRRSRGCLGGRRGPPRCCGCAGLEELGDCAEGALRWDLTSDALKLSKMFSLHPVDDMENRMRTGPSVPSKTSSMSMSVY
ncbi:uncharacterized protein AAGF69_003797 [Amazona ochrocephala]